MFTFFNNQGVRQLGPSFVSPTNLGKYLRSTYGTSPATSSCNGEITNEHLISPFMYKRYVNAISTPQIIKDEFEGRVDDILISQSWWGRPIMSFDYFKHTTAFAAELNSNYTNAGLTTSANKILSPDESMLSWWTPGGIEQRMATALMFGGSVVNMSASFMSTVTGKGTTSEETTLGDGYSYSDTWTDSFGATIKGNNNGQQQRHTCYTTAQELTGEEGDQFHMGSINRSSFSKSGPLPARNTLVSLYPYDSYTAMITGIERSTFTFSVAATGFTNNPKVTDILGHDIAIEDPHLGDFSTYYSGYFAASIELGLLWRKRNNCIEFAFFPTVIMGTHDPVMQSGDNRGLQSLDYTPYGSQLGGFLYNSYAPPFLGIRTQPSLNLNNLAHTAYHETQDTSSSGIWGLDTTKQDNYLSGLEVYECDIALRLGQNVLNLKAYDVFFNTFTFWYQATVNRTATIDGNQRNYTSTTTIEVTRTTNTTITTPFKVDIDLYPGC